MFTFAAMAALMLTSCKPTEPVENKDKVVTGLDDNHPVKGLPIGDTKIESQFFPVPVNLCVGHFNDPGCVCSRSIFKFNPNWCGYVLTNLDFDNTVVF